MKSPTDWRCRGQWQTSTRAREVSDRGTHPFRGGSVSTGDVLVGLVADLLGPEEDLLGYLKEREGIPTGGLYSPSDSLPNCYIPLVEKPVDA